MCKVQKTAIYKDKTKCANFGAESFVLVSDLNEHLLLLPLKCHLCEYADETSLNFQTARSNKLILSQQAEEITK